jgi:Trypsin-co-occurring domain 2
MLMWGRGLNMSDSDDRGLLDLAEAVEGLRAELTRAVEKGSHQQTRMRFRITEPVVLEVQAVTSRDVNGKVGWKIVEVGGAYTKENTHRLTVKLSPEWWDGQKGAYTSDFLISASLPAPIETQASAGGAASGTATEQGPDPADAAGVGRGPVDDRLDEDDA